LNKVIKASGNSVEGYWPGLFAKALQGADISSLLTNVSAGPAAGAAGPAASADAAPAKEEEKAKSEKKEDSDDDDQVDGMGGLFGDDEY
jgi:large subunit ribosomal protein LP1